MKRETRCFPHFLLGCAAGTAIRKVEAGAKKYEECISAGLERRTAGLDNIYIARVETCSPCCEGDA